MPASTTAKRPTTNPDIKFNDALEKAKYRITAEFEHSSYADVAELICKLMARYAREEMLK